MAKLVLSLNGTLLNQYFIDRDSLGIGRDAGNEIVIDDPLLSRRHARILCVGEDHIIEDLGSANGTRINGQPQTRRILQHRDVVELGAHHLCYMNSRLAAELSLDQTMLIEALPRDALAAATPPTGILASKASQVYFPDGHVKVLDTAGHHAVGDIVRLERVVTTFGTPSEQLVVFTRRPQGFFVSHVEGSRPPRVNQQGIAPGPHALNDGDLVEAAGYRLEFHLDRRSDSRL
jgi:pSer/pThr/pTyr-binding forkhead associated (FHA) protein